jgi:hypothetical protein
MSQKQKLEKAKKMQNFPAILETPKNANIEK